MEDCPAGQVTVTLRVDRQVGAGVRPDFNILFTPSRSWPPRRPRVMASGSIMPNGSVELGSPPGYTDPA
jgi:hypothetical protein